MKNILFLSAIVFLTSCGGGNSAEPEQNKDITACDCAKEMNTNAKAANAEICMEKRSEPAFDREVVECYFTEIGFAPSVGTEFKDVPADGKYVLSPDDSKIAWQGSKFTGDTHNGRMLVKGGEITFTNGAPTAGFIVLDMRSITVTDLEGDEKSDLESHLNSADFFDTENNPEARFELVASSALETGHFALMGRLTIKGITHDFTTRVWFGGAEGQMAGSGALLVDRSQFDVRFGSNNFFDNLGDKAIRNEIIIRTILKGSLQPA